MNGEGVTEYTIVLDFEHWEKSTWQMQFGRMVRNARAHERLLEGRDDEWGAFMQCDLDREWLLVMGSKKHPLVTDQREEWRALWMIGGMKGWLDEAIEALVPADEGSGVLNKETSVSDASRSG